MLPWFASESARARTVIAGLVLVAGAGVLSPAFADMLTGKITAIENGGQVVTLAEKRIAVSGSRTNICISGVCDRDRALLKTGMSCQADVASRGELLEARRLSCR